MGLIYNFVMVVDLRLCDDGGSTMVIVIVIVEDLLVMGEILPPLSVGRGHPGQHHGLNRGEERSTQTQRKLEASLFFLGGGGAAYM